MMGMVCHCPEDRRRAERRGGEGYPTKERKVQVAFPSSPPHHGPVEAPGHGCPPALSAPPQRGEVGGPWQARASRKMKAFCTCEMKILFSTEEGSTIVSVQRTDSDLFINKEPTSLAL